MLDFYLLGIGRSGTTACRRVINLNKRLYCGVERFPTDVDPRTVTFPESFISDKVKGVRDRIEGTREELANWDVDAVRVVGDKFPRKFYMPDHLGMVKNSIAIYRRHSDVIPSWQVRAENREDKSWAPERTGVFFFLDFLTMLYTVPHVGNVAWVDYYALFFGDYERELRLIHDTLGLSLDDFDLESFLENSYNISKIKNKTRVLGEREQRIADKLGIEQFEDAFFSTGGQKERQACFKAYSEKLLENAGDHFAFIVEQMTIPELRELFWFIRTVNRNFSEDDFNRIFKPGETESREDLFHLLLYGVRYGSIPGGVEKALAYFEKAKDVLGDSPDILNFYGKLLMRVGRDDEALAVQLKAVELQPLAAYYSDLGKLYMRASKTREAIEAMEKAIGINPNSPFYYEMLGKLQIDAGEYGKAEASLTKGLEVANYLPSLHVLRSQALNGLDRAEEAKRELKTGLELVGDNPALLMGTAKSLETMGRYDDAADCMRRLIESDPMDPSYQWRLCRNLQNAGRNDEAYEEARKATLRENAPASFFHYFSGLQMQRKDMAGCETSQRKAVELEPQNPGFQLRFSRVLVRNGKLDEARKAAEAAVESGGDNPEYYKQLGVVLDMLGEGAKARECLAKAESMG